MSKGSAPRPIPDRASYEANFDAIFRRGVPEGSKGAGSNPAESVGSNPTPAAIYVNESGQ